jgi:hypothetical protein
VGTQHHADAATALLDHVPQPQAGKGRGLIRPRRRRWPISRAAG